jgi:hypothetical protein
MPKIYYYKMSVDNGGAPCVQDRLLSLAICKPEIRRCAQVGDWILGFGANSFQAAGRLHRGNPLVYVARVTGKERGETYYTEITHRDRADCIYEQRAGRFRRRAGALYHDRPESLPHDLGEYPYYPKSAVLLSNDFRYFAGGGTTEYGNRLPNLIDAVQGIGRGHRVAHPGTQLSVELIELQRWLWREFTESVNLGEPNELAAASRRRGSTTCRVLPKSAAVPITRKVGRVDC